MAYAVHNFLTGQKLTADALNEMDAQIKETQEKADGYTLETITEVVKGLKLKSDGGYVGLYLGDVLLDEAEIGDVSSIIPCEGLTVTAPEGDTITLQAGVGSVSIVAEVTPSDCNQSVRYKSSDIGVVNATSAGVVTGKALGKAMLTVMCGKFSKVFSVNVWEQARPDWVGGNWVTAPYTLGSQTGMGIDVTSSQKRALCYPYTDQQGILLRAGDKITVTCGSDYAIAYYYILVPGAGGLTYTTVAHNGSIFVVVDDKNGGSVTSNQPTSEEATKLTYTAEQECYFCMSVLHKNAVNQEFTEEELTNLSDSVVCRVEVP